MTHTATDDEFDFHVYNIKSGEFKSWLTVGDRVTVGGVVDDAEPVYYVPQIKMHVQLTLHVELPS